VYVSSVISRGGESTREKEFTSWLRVRSLFSTWEGLEILFSYPFIPEICSGLILTSRLDTKIRSNANFRLNSNFRNYFLNLAIHDFTLVPHDLSPHKLGYPWVMTTLLRD